MWAQGADFHSTPWASLTYLSVVRRTLFFAVALCVVGTVSLAGSRSAWAKANGFAGDSCTGCHRGGTPFTPKISADPATIKPGETTTLTLTWPGSAGGFFLNSNQKGSFTEIAGEGTQKASETGVTHRSPKPASGGMVTVKVKWTAPSGAPGGVDFDLTALSANGDNSTRGDIEGLTRFNFSYGCEGVDVYLDQDGDGFGLTDSRGPQRRCALEAGWSMKSGDCNDYDKNANPMGTEICNLYDDDCDGMVNEGLENIMVYRDEDGDGHGARFNAETQVGCGNGAGWSSLKDDCDDKDRMIYPGQKETCNYKDDNCNNRVDEGARSSCGVGWCRREASSCEMNASCTPNAPRVEMCNGLDEDCDGVIDNGKDLCPAGQSCYKAQCIASDVAAEMAAKDPPPPPPMPVDGGAGAGGSSGGTAGSKGTSEPGGSGTGPGSGSGESAGSGDGDSPRPGIGCSYGGRGAGPAALLLLGVVLAFAVRRARR
jgi:hypothetical protein